jgi:hypothetical protein
VPVGQVDARGEWIATLRAVLGDSDALDQNVEDAAAYGGAPGKEILREVHSHDLRDPRFENFSRGLDHLSLSAPATHGPNEALLQVDEHTTTDAPGRRALRSYDRGQDGLPAPFISFQRGIENDVGLCHLR